MDNDHKTESQLYKDFAGKNPHQGILDRVDELLDFYDFSPVGYLTLDSKGRILAANLTFVSVLWVARSELIGKSFYKYIVPKDRDILYFHLRSLFKYKKPQTCEFQIESTPGKVFHVSLNSIFAQDRKGRHVCRSVLTDITERRKAEKELRASEERLRLTVQGGRLGTWDLDFTTNEVVCNDFLYEMLDQDPSDRGLDLEVFFDFIHPDDLERVNRDFEETLKNRTDFSDEFRIIHKNKEIRWLASSGRIYRNPDGQPVRIAGVFFDITERKLMEEELRRSHEELEKRVEERTAELQKRTEELEDLNLQLKEMNERIAQEHSHRIYLSRKLVKILEKERRDMAMALHDGAGQILATLKMDLERMDINPDRRKQAELLNSARKKISDLIGFVKDTSRQLRPSVLDTLGLLPAVHSLIDQVKKDADGLEIDLFTQSIPEHLDSDKQTALYRVIQEALTNCLKYAEAEKVYIGLVKRDQSMVLTVEDNGKGFDYEKISGRTEGEEPTGISIMRERAMQHGGTFWIESSPGRGTYITVEIPV